MSRSIRGYSSANLTINELSLLGIDVATLGATVGDIVTLNSTTINVTNANITNLSLSGTLTIVNITSSGTISANNVVCTGEITYKYQTLDNRFVKSTALTTILLNYVTNSSLATTLTAYPTNTSLATTLSDYVLTTALNTTLSNYVLTSALNTTLSNYVLTSSLNTTLGGYVDKSSAESIGGVKTFTSNTNIEKITMDTGTIFNHSSNVYQGFRGQYTTGIGFNMAFWASDGHVRFQSASNTGFRYYISGTEVLQLTNDTLDCKNDFLCGGEITYKTQTLDNRFVQPSVLSGYIDKTSAETITGAKTFDNDVTINHPHLLVANKIKMDLPLIAGVSGNEFNVVLWNKDNANQEKQLGNTSALFYDAFNGILKAPRFTATYNLTAPNIVATTEITTPSLKITTATTASVNAYFSVLIRNSDATIITDTELLFNSYQNILKSRSLYIENNIIFADEDSNGLASGNVEYQMMSREATNTRMRYSTNATINGNFDTNNNARLTIHSIKAESITLNNLPLNYTQRLHTVSYGTSSFVGGVYSWGGNSFYVKPLSTIAGDRIETYGLNVMAVNMTTSGIMSLTSSDYEGVWEIDISLTFKNDGTTRMNPYIQIHKNNAYSNRFSTSAQYCRSDQAMHTTLNIKGFDLVDSTDTYKIVTKITTGTEENYGTTGVTTWTGTNLSISWKYLGDLSEHSHSIS